MAKKVEKKEEYEYIIAEVDCDTLTVRSKLKDNPREATDQHDEDVSDWSESDIRQCVKSLLDLDYDETKLVKVEYC